jgi:hypothetical protein
MARLIASIAMEGDSRPRDALILYDEAGVPLLAGFRETARV